ncbi:response regulator [Labrys monachus]|uniref:histidine kinase n=1 Tax=Labrys monachus TaxID=217067 RepID=A0ABU0F868_9HYPH|nr:response regulator [Labrys monachus]MDQ0390805.1 two-component sensor histidine kinase [Labrys monachus]
MASQPSPISILYIDDDPGLARLVQKSLGRRGYVVETALTGKQGFERLDRGGIDVIALDHFLSSGTGLEFLAELHARPSPPPVVYVTASAETSVAVAALKAGAADYVAKTTGEEFLELLGSAVDQAIEKARLERERDRAEREVREARDRAEILLHEVNHRVANSLALVAALVRMQANAIAEPSAKRALAETQTRISAIAGVHRRLYTSEDVRSVEISGYLANVLQELETTLNPSGKTSTIRLIAEPVAVPTDKAVSIGVIVTELVTNSFKYAYPDDSSGDIRVRFHRTSENSANLTVEDDGVGWNGTGPLKGTGVGSRIVTALARSLAATVEYRETAGCCVSFDFEI